MADIKLECKLKPLERESTNTGNQKYMLQIYAEGEGPDMELLWKKLMATLSK